MRIIKCLSAYSDTFLVMLSFMVTIFIGFVRHITGPELALSLFYLFPIAMVSWNVGFWSGIFISISSAVSWLVADLTLLDKFSKTIIPFINETFRLIVFIVVAITVFELKKAIEKHKGLARTDPLTGISNRRAFFEFADMEINKARRFNRPISMLYIDIDNFKAVNDNYGHHVGDQLLCAVADMIKDHVRVIDIVARFGGDEFGILMSRTKSDASYSVAEKIREKLLLLANENGWPVTYSMGLITYECLPESIEELIRNADMLMYSAKKNGKNRIEHKVIGKISDSKEAA